MCLQLLRTKLCFSKRQFHFGQSTTNRYRSIPIYLSNGVDYRYQLITTLILAIDWSSIINISRLIDIDYHWLCTSQIEASTSPPRATPGHLYFLQNFCSNSPLPRPESCSNAPSLVHPRWSNAPTPGKLFGSFYYAPEAVYVNMV